MNGTLRNALMGASTVACMAAATPAMAQIKSFDIPAQDAAAGISALGRQADVQIAASRRDTRNKRTNAVKGSMAVEQALTQLLAGTGLTARSTGAQTYTVVPFAAPAETAGEASSESATPSWSEEEDSAIGGEIIVTAQKREQRLSDVPAPVTVLSPTNLADTNQVPLRDYYVSVPGLNLITNFGFRQNLNIRGVTTGGFSNPTVGIVIDDVPFGASTNNGGGNDVPDIDPNDLARIEVLRGPQGTLYGANSMGGLIKYVTKDPEPGAFSAQAGGGLTAISGGGAPGYHARLSVNAPLQENAALRMSGFLRRDPGYIDNPTIGRSDVNDGMSYGARGALLVDLGTATFRLSALYQNDDLDGNPDVVLLPGSGDLEQNYIPGTGGSEREIQFYTATIGADLGFAELAAITGYNRTDSENSWDRSSNWGARTLTHFGVGGLSARDLLDLKKFSQEIRLTGRIGAAIDWQLGGFYTRESTHIQQFFQAADVDTGDVVGIEWYRDVPNVVREHALFGNVSWRPFDRFELLVGGRHSWIAEDDDIYTQTGPYVGGTAANPATSTSPAISSRDKAFTYLVTPSFKVTPDLLLYARLASGYRPGGPNFPVEDAPSQYKADKTENYELGLKGSLLGGRVTVDASLYRIDWKDLQISLRNASQTATFFTNGSKARSSGFELAVDAMPWTGMKLGAWYAYSDAKLVEPFPGSGTPASPVYGEAGDPLPNTARHSWRLSAEQEFAIGNGATAYVGGAFHFIGDRVGVFTASPVRQDYPSYTRTDLRAGVRWDNWRVEAYVNNLTDERGLIGGGIGYQPSYSFVYIRPRLVGLTVGMDFR